MSKLVLDLGNCDLDHASIAQMIREEFDAEVLRAHTEREALAILDRHQVDLVLVNRIFDRDQAEGLAVLKKIKAAVRSAATPVMLITNFAEHQQKAMAAGGELGFGKADVNRPATIERLKPFLRDSRP